jgi:glycogen synthase
VPYLIASLGIKGDVLFHAQDWETACIALTSMLAVRDTILQSTRTVLTLHNSFDAELPESIMRTWFGRGFEGKTVLQATIPFLDAPVITVSASFARELTLDPLQRKHFIPHLQLLLHNTAVAGIEHGLFGSGKIPFKKSVIHSALKGRGAELLQEKKEFRKALIDEIGSRKERTITGTIQFHQNQPNPPIFFMMGRLDIMQKGFDVIFHAFPRLKRGSAKLIFCPSLAPGQPAGVLDFFKRIALQRDGDIAIWPFRLDREEYKRCLQGASFLIMRSLYEPFGAATEGYMNGTPVIGRATGGLVSQIISMKPVDSIQDDSNQSLHATGILFREKYLPDPERNGWRALLQTPLNRRMEIPLYRSMVDAAAQALNQAIQMYHHDQDYARMIVNGIHHLKHFQWALSARSYRAVYTAATGTSCL